MEASQTTREPDAGNDQASETVAVGMPNPRSVINYMSELDEKPGGCVDDLFKTLQVCLVIGLSFWFLL
jgi:hypothetical protein